MAATELVLVTGGSGFLGAHCIVALLREGYRVRTTLRSMKRADEVRAMVKAGGASDAQVDGVEFAIVDLTKDDGWEEACKGCTYVLHVASPFPPSVPKHPDDLIVPAREGTLRALRAAKAAGGVKRVVVTSSTAAVAYGHPQRAKPLTEEDWTNLDDPNVHAYPRSKTIAEQAAWDWIRKEGGSIELAVVNPVGIFGPVLGKDYAASIELIVRLVNGQLPGLPHFGMKVVDVRDAADLHIKAMTDPQAAGQRFIACADEPFMWVSDIAESLKRQLGRKAKRVPTRGIPNFVMRLMGYFDPAVKFILPELDKVTEISNAKAKETLQWQPRSADETLRDSAESLFQFALAKPGE